MRYINSYVKFKRLRILIWLLVAWNLLVTFNLCVISRKVDVTLDLSIATGKLVIDAYQELMSPEKRLERYIDIRMLNGRM